MQADTQTLRRLRDENIRLKDKVQRLQTEVERLHHIIHALNTLQYHIDAITPETDVVALIHNILSVALEAVDSENGSLLLFDEEANQLVFVDVIGQGHHALSGYRMPSNKGVAGWVITTKSPVLIANARHDERWYPIIDDAIGFHTASLIGVPLLDGGRPLGVIEVVNSLSGGSFREDDMDIMTLVARLASLALVRAEQTEESGSKVTATP